MSSTRYGIRFLVTLPESSSEKVHAIMKAIRTVWEVEPIQNYDSDDFEFYGENALKYPPDRKFLEPIYEKIAEANGSPCLTEIEVVHIEQTPFQQFFFGPGAEEEEEGAELDTYGELDEPSDKF